MFCGSGMNMVSCDPETNRPVMGLNASSLERAHDLLKKTQQIVHRDNATYVWNVTGADHMNVLFRENRMVFNSEGVGALPGFNSQMEADFGVLPMPKYDKNQKEYHTFTWGGGSTMCIPSGIKNKEEFELVLKAFVILSQKTVTHAFYDTMIATRGIRDVESGEVLDTLFANRIYDMPQYFSTLGLSDIFNESVSSNKDDFVSSYQRQAKRFDMLVDKILNKLEKE